MESPAQSAACTTGGFTWVEGLSRVPLDVSCSKFCRGNIDCDRIVLYFQLSPFSISPFFTPRKNKYRIGRRSWRPESFYRKNHLLNHVVRLPCPCSWRYPFFSSSNAIVVPLPPYTADITSSFQWATPAPSLPNRILIKMASYLSSFRRNPEYHYTDKMLADRLQIPNVPHLLNPFDFWIPPKFSVFINKINNTLKWRGKK